MKRKSVLFLLALLVVCSTSYAQTFDLGIKAGINSQKITTSSLKGISGPYTFSDFKSDLKMGYNFGVFARLGGKKIYLQPEVLYSVKKSQSSFIETYNSAFTALKSAAVASETDYPVDQSLEIRSIQVPLLVGYKLINLKLISLRVFTGPAMSVILDNSKVGFKNLVSEDFDAKNFNNNIWDWQLGGGVDVGNLVMDIRYEWGISNISDGNPSKLSFVNKGNTLTLSLGLKIF